MTKSSGCLRKELGVATPLQNTMEGNSSGRCATSRAWESRDVEWGLEKELSWELGRARVDLAPRPEGGRWQELCPRPPHR